MIARKRSHFNKRYRASQQRPILGYVLPRQKVLVLTSICSSPSLSSDLRTLLSLVVLPLKIRSLLMICHQEYSPGNTSSPMALPLINRNLKSTLDNITPKVMSRPEAKAQIKSHQRIIIREPDTEAERFPSQQPPLILGQNRSSSQESFTSNKVKLFPEIYKVS
jgi:hypothetical protein